MKAMIKGKIWFEGKTYPDIEMAIDEAKKEILRELELKSSGITSGFRRFRRRDRIGDGNYGFEIGDKKLFVKYIAKPKEGKDEGWIWIKHMDAGKGWIPQLREELLKEEHNALFLIPILLKAIVNLDKRVSELEKSEETRELIKRGG